MRESLLRQAFRLQEEAARQGFDWPEVGPAWEKLQEEIAELQAAVSVIEQSSELGDVLFSVINLARLMNIDPDTALADASTRFSRRFKYVLQDSDKLPPAGDPRRLDVMERRWQQAKHLERDQSSKLTDLP